MNKIQSFSAGEKTYPKMIIVSNYVGFYIKVVNYGFSDVIQGIIDETPKVYPDTSVGFWKVNYKN